MLSKNEGCYKLQKEDIQKAGVALADAFQNDSIWKLFFKEEATLGQKGLFFETPVRYCIKYGKIYATSEQLEGIAAWVPGSYADITTWRIIQSGALISGIKAVRACTKLAQQQEQIFKPLNEARKNNMEGREYIYLLIIGISSAFQGQGLGRKLIKALIVESTQTGIPVYTETQSEKNVSFYESLGFKTISKITLPIIDLPHWELIREPES
jgi:ribosomal protein S18 acetylase RimI-like enzyme